MKVFLLGATGRMGRSTAALLVRRSVASSLTLAARGAPLLERMAAEWRASGVPIRYEVVDVTRTGATAMMEHDVVVCCAGPAFDTETGALDAAIAAGVPYVSLCDDHGAFVAARARAGAARKAGVAAIIGCGLSPGLTNLLYAHAAQRLDTVRDAAIAVAGAVADGKGPAALRQLQVASAGPPIPVYFPEPVGWVETFRRRQPEAAALRVPTEVRSGLTEKGAMDLLRATAPAARAWTGLAARLAPAARMLPPRGPVWSAARVDVHGMQAGVPTTITFGVVDHLANLAAPTLIDAAGALARGDVEPGIHAAHEVLDAPAILTHLIRDGVRLARLEPEPV